MSDETYAGGLPPAGWYPDPDVAGQARWWDGTQWHASQPARPYLPPSVGSASILSVALVWLIGAQGVLALVLVGLYTWGHFHLSSTVAYEDSFTTYDIVDMAVVGVAGLLQLASIIVWCFWQYRLAAAAPPDRIRRGPGMHVGSWFIPVVLLWFPYQNIKDLWGAFVGRKVPFLLGGWWTLWIIGNFTGRALLAAVFGESTAREVNDLSLVDAAFQPGLAALAIVIVLRLTRAARAREADRLTA